MVDEAAERQAIQQVVQGLQAAWNRGDAAGYAAFFSDDADFVAWNGMYGRGRQTIEEGHRLLFGGPLAGSQMTFSEDGAGPAGASSARFVRPDVAILVTSGAVITAGQSATDPDHQSVQTFVMIKDDGHWQVAAFQNTRASG
jgi:uncharacterized protein (TIGR02246 family)